MSTISSKQDSGYARTAQDLERKYQFGKTFAEMLGLINDGRDKVNSVESTLRGEIEETSTTLKRDTEQIIMEAEARINKSVGDSVDEISQKVEMKIDANKVGIIVEQEIANGVDRVETKSGYVFDADGLNISKSGEEIGNQLTHKGMYVTKSGENILVADKDGVSATDLHAKTYLIIGEGDGRSRFEDYGINRTGCFWVGG